MWSISFSYRLGLAFHALNNEGADGSNLMQPRRIDVGRLTYDGISGEMIRRHVLENFVSLCKNGEINLLPTSEALHPDRGPIALRHVAKEDLKSETLNKKNIFKAARLALEKCALIDVGGYLAAFSKEASGGGIPESELEKAIATVATGDDRPYTVKRDSVFDVGWLISEEPQEMTITQHAAYRPTGDQSLFSQTMRSNIYAGVMRADLHRIGTDDYWYLERENGQKISRLAVKDQSQRQKALTQAMIDYLASPTGAKVAGWAPHVFKTEGVILLTSTRTAPFASPIKMDLANPDQNPIARDYDYQSRMKDLADANKNDTFCWPFSDVKTLLEAGKAILKKLVEPMDGRN